MVYDYKRILVDCLDQTLRWKANLDHPQDKRSRNDCNDKEIVQSIRYWTTSYLNGVILQGWVKTHDNNDDEFSELWDCEYCGCKGNSIEMDDLYPRCRMPRW